MDFLDATPEVASLNQYWYSPKTIGAIVEELESGRCGLRVAFLSTPSLFFSLPESSEVRRASYCFDLDEQWATAERFRRFDFHDEKVDDDLAHSFDCVVVDPPFITRDVWTKYAACVRSALRPGGRVVLTTVGETGAASTGASTVARTVERRSDRARQRTRLRPSRGTTTRDDHESRTCE